MSDEQFERDLRRTLVRMTAEPASPALRTRVRETLATPRTSVRRSWRVLPRLAAGLAAVILVVGAAGLLFALRPQQPVGPGASASPGQTPVGSPSATAGPPIVLPSGVPPTSWSRVPDAPDFHVGPVQGTAIAVAPDGAFVAVVSSIDSGRAPEVFRSTDGTGWTPSGSLPQGSYAGVSAIVACGGSMVAVGADWAGTNSGKSTGTNPAPRAAVWTSTDGVTWRRVPDQPAFAAGEFDRVAAGPAGFLAVGRDYDMPAWSPDGTNWTRVDVGTPNALVRGVAATNDGFVAVGGIETAAVAWTSRDGRHWIRATFDGASQLDARLLSVAGQGQRLVALGAVPARGDESVPDGWTGLAVWASADRGATWTKTVSGLAAPSIYPPSVPKLYALSGGFVALGSLGPGGASVWSSRDGAAWRSDAIAATSQDAAFAFAVSGSRAVIIGSTVGGMGGDRVEFWIGDAGASATANVPNLAAVAACGMPASAASAEAGTTGWRLAVELDQADESVLLFVSGTDETLCAVGRGSDGRFGAVQTDVGRMDPAPSSALTYDTGVGAATAAPRQIIVGRAPAGAAAVVVTAADGSSSSAALGNGHYIARLETASSVVRIVALDASGSTLVDLSGVALKPFVSATPSPSPAAAGPDSSWLARAGSLIQALGYDVPGGGTVGQEADTTTGATNMVVRFGTAWQVQWDTSGVLTFVFRTASPPGTPAVTKDVASGRVVSVAAAVGYSIPTDSVPLTFDADLWTASWPRTVDGVPTMDDGTGITLYADGSFAGFHHLDRTLEPKPAHVLSHAEAEAAFVAARSSRSSLLPVQVADATLTWAPPVAPGTGPSPTLRLCWVLSLKVVGGDPGQFARAVLDAGTGVELWVDSTA